MQQRFRHICGVLITLCCTTSISPADVTDSTTTGFTVVHTSVIKASTVTVYARLVEDIQSWWNPQHSWSGEAGRLSISGRAGGCFCESLPGGGSVEHMRVVYAEPGKTLRMTGGLGPLQSLAVTGSMTWGMEDLAGMTTLTLTYTVTGYLPGGLQALAGPVDGVLGEQVQRLKNYIETGTP